MPSKTTGWNRLLAVLCGIYLIVLVVGIAGERNRINVFDQFDTSPPQYQFWSWSDFVSKNSELRALRLNVGVSALFAVVPPALAFALLHSVFWVIRGFRILEKRA